jgi:hypothetical protein
MLCFKIPVLIRACTTRPQMPSQFPQFPVTELGTPYQLLIVDKMEMVRGFVTAAKTRQSNLGVENG